MVTNNVESHTVNVFSLLSVVLHNEQHQYFSLININYLLKKAIGTPKRCPPAEYHNKKADVDGATLYCMCT